MAKYRFRLQKVMEVKQCAEDRKKQDLAAAERVLDREKRRLDTLTSEGDECRQEILERPSERIDVVRELAGRARFRRLKRDVNRQERTVEHSNQKVDTEREALLQCSKERKMLENLRDKGLLECMREWLRREQKEVDEVARDTFLRRSE